MSKKSKESKISELEKSYRGALTEFIYKWNESLSGDKIIEAFWAVNEPEEVEIKLKESGLLDGKKLE
jgi:hypothetical protein